jgi:hypothetical protein
MPQDIIRLTGSHALVIPNLPEKENLAPLSKKAEMEAKEIASFGLFDTATPNFSNYYPGVTKEDLNPEADKASFIFPVFRALSEVIVHRKYNPIDFGENKALRNSLGMLKAQSVYANHEMSVGNELGSVLDESWQNSYKTESGITVPAGINTRFKLDGKSNPKIARGILMEPPSIHSTSVTVEFKWEPSHPSMEANEFVNKIGTFGSDGKLVRRVVNEVTKYHEISLVAHGADPFAQLLKDAKNINNPEYADKVYNSLKAESKRRVYSFSYKENLTSLEELEPEHEDITKNQIKTMEHLLKLAATLGIDTTGKDEAQLAAAISSTLSVKLSENVTVSQQLADAKAKLATATDELTALKASNPELTKLADIGKAALTTKREAVKAQLALLKDNNVDATLLAVVENADLTALTALEKDYATQLDAKAPLHCEECSSTKVSRRTSTAEEGAEGSAQNQNAKPKTVIEAAKEIASLKAPKSIFS